MTMAKQMRVLLTAATLSAVSAVCAAQAAVQSGPANSNSQQQQAAPVEHAFPNQGNFPASEMPLRQETIAPNEELAPGAGEAQATPIPGVSVRVGMQSAVREVSSDAAKLELSVERGVANVNVHNPGKDKLLLVDLPGGQTQLLKNGLYTFDAGTNTVGVLKGEALAFPHGAAADAKPLKVKEYNKVVFSGTGERTQQFDAYEASADLLPGPAGPQGEGAYGHGAYGYGPYGDGFYGYPYYAYGYPGWDYPYYDYGLYPYGVGLGFGYYGGFHGGGYHGGGFHGGGGGFHGGGGGFHGGGGGGHHGR